MDLGVSEKVRPLIAAVREMVRDDVIPMEHDYEAEIGKGGDRFAYTPRMTEIMEGLKAKAKARGLWNFWLTGSDKGYGLSTVEYAHIAEEMGWSAIASEVFNCSAPDTGNMEVVERFGSPEHKARWLPDLLEGKTRSAYLMTEPGVASSDATNIAMDAKLDGDHWVLNGEKWWSSGAGDPRCTLYVTMAVTDPEASRQARTPLDVFRRPPIRPESPEAARDDRLRLRRRAARPSPHPFRERAHPEGRPHRRARQGVRDRAGATRDPAASTTACAPSARPSGRWRRCADARCRARRSGRNSRNLGANRDIIAEARMNIEMARLLCLKAAWAMDTMGNRAAAPLISQIKVVAPRMALEVIDQAVQMHGGAGREPGFPARPHVDERSHAAPRRRPRRRASARDLQGRAEALHQRRRAPS